MQIKSALKLGPLTVNAVLFVLHRAHSHSIFGLSNAMTGRPRRGRRGFLFAESIVRLIARPRNRIRLLFLGIAHPADPEGKEARDED